MGNFSSSSATLTTILITAEAGSVIKSVRYDKKQRLELTYRAGIERLRNIQDPTANRHLHWLLTRLFGADSSSEVSPAWQRFSA